MHCKASADKCKRANRHNRTLTERHTTVSVWLNCISNRIIYIYIFYTLLNHTPESLLNFRKRIRLKLQRAVDSARGDLFLHICFSVLLCRARQPYFVDIKRTNVAYFNNIFIRRHIFHSSSGSSLLEAHCSTAWYESTLQYIFMWDIFSWKNIYPQVFKNIFSVTDTECCDCIANMTFLWCLICSQTLLLLILIVITCTVRINIYCTRAPL